MGRNSVFGTGGRVTLETTGASLEKKKVLDRISFGAQVAEEERDQLIRYFVETDQWKKLMQGDIDVVYGPKGSGKSAIYFAILSSGSELLNRRILVEPAESPMSSPAFKDIVEKTPESEHIFRFAWNLYFLSLLGETFRKHGINNKSARKVENYLEDAGLLSRRKNLRNMLRVVVSYFASLLHPKSVEAGIELDSVTGMPKGFSGKITFRDPGAHESGRGYTSVGQLYSAAQNALEASEFTIWLIIDRLDVAFFDQPKVEKQALRSLFLAYKDLSAYRNISLKIFMRNDIWKQITSEGFREASHIVRDTNITWDSSSLLNLVIRRLLENKAVLEYYKVDKDDVLGDASKQESLFYRVFPKQVDSGVNKPDTFRWMLSRTQDGRKQASPRELIHLLIAARTVQIKKLENGEEVPPEETLISRAALKEALPTVSTHRLTRTLYAEYPHLKSYVEKLEGEKTEQTLETLCSIWGLGPEEAGRIAAELVETGFFELRGDKGKQSYWVPFLYRDGLHMVQGKKAEEEIDG